MRFHLGLVSKAKRFFLYSPAKVKTENGENPVGDLGPKSKPVVESEFRYSSFGSKDEDFLDSKAWLDSDCEDDFFSVNGDFTPSRGNTPIHHFSIPRSPLATKSVYDPTFPNTKSRASPTCGKRKLFDLLQEAFQGEDTETNEKTDDFKLGNSQLPSRSYEASPYFSGTNSVWSSEATPSRENKKKERNPWPKNCCFPALLPSLSFNDRRKQKQLNPSQ